MKKAISFLLLLALVLNCFAFTAFAAEPIIPDEPAQYVNPAVDHVTYGRVRTAARKNTDGTVTVTIMETPSFELKTYTTVVPLNDAKNTNPLTNISRADVLPSVLALNAFAEIRFNSDGECIDMELIEYGTATSLDSASYGGELTAKGGGAGNMVAQGWILDKDEYSSTIKIGDGNNVVDLFNQTYYLADDVKIYVIDNPASSSSTSFRSDGSTWGLVKEGTFDDIKVTEKQEDGEIYYTQERWTALCIFDSNYQTSWKDGSAKVKELYLYSKPTTMSASEMVTPDGMQYSGTSWYPGKSRAEEETDYNFAGAAEPIEFMKGRLYAVGDTYTSIMLYVGDDGTTSLMDMGNRRAQYQYYLAVEKVGYDPREINNIFLTHGHADHYEAMYEFSTMIRRAGNTNYHGWANEYCQNGGTFTSDKGNTYTMNGTNSDRPVLYATDAIMPWHEWVDILGPGADMYIWPAMGHSNDTASFVFKMTATADDAYFEEGDIVSFLYFGGYAVRQGASNGFARLQLVNSLQFQQAMVAQWADAMSDYIYPLCQHTNQVSMLEISKASRIAGIPFMQGYVGGLEEVGNYCENRIANMLYQSYNDAYEDNYNDKLSNILRDAGLPVPDQIDWNLMPAAPFPGYVYVEGTRGTKRLDTIEEHGPYKRPDGEYKITVNAVQVVHGYDAFMNKNPLFADQTNVYGFTLDQGFPILWDTYTHDPDGWFVQIYADVDDDYDGGVNYATNWLTLIDPNAYTTNTNGQGDQPTTWTSGPVELVNPKQGNYEFLRLPRFDTQEEAEAFAKALTNGGYEKPYEVYNVNGGLMYQYSDNGKYEIDDFGAAPTDTATYMVNMDKMSHIILKEDFASTFRPVAANPLSLTTEAHNVKAGDYFTMNATFNEQQSSNAVILTYTFDGDKFEYANFTAAQGVQVVNTEYDKGIAKITVISMNYDMESFGDIMLRAKEGAELAREFQTVSLTAEYVLKDEDGNKEILTANASARFTTLGNGTIEPVEPGDTNDDGVVDLIDLSNMIDWFGTTLSSADWETLYTFFDFNNNGEIDISDITYVAKLIK